MNADPRVEIIAEAIGARWVLLDGAEVQRMARVAVAALDAAKATP